ncbi:MAG TPA: DUF5714 domain-containing protein [Geobacteraceae bacterium]|nr:DUF5714 domain-containing protein [Geobacteraceae bacterium]
MSYRTGCLICGFELAYLPETEMLNCEYCARAFSTEVRCINNHYVCDSCHSLAPNDLIERFCRTTPLRAPHQIAATLMKNPRINVHGPEHHFLVSAALLAAWYNRHINPLLKDSAIIMARRRAEDIKGGVCGSHGSCGAAIGTGIFISLITGATPLSKEEWRLANLMTSESLHAIALSGGPRCCKRDSFLAINAATDFLKNHFAVELPKEENIICEFAILNPECLGEECRFYGS